MRALLINTCGVEGMVGLGEDGAVVAEERLPGRAASERLVGVVRALLGARGWGLGSLGVVGVVVGPGSFTGVRVGLAAAKGFCEAGGVGMVAMSRLELVAREGEVGVLDAGRGEYYLGAVGAGAEALVGRAEVLRVGEGSGLVTCEERVVEALAGVRRVGEPGVAEMLGMVMGRISRGAWSDVAVVDANYLRRTDAELTVKGGG